MEVITLLAYFNTSHVTVYLFWWIHYRVQIIFQYISCYCLSLNTSSVLIPFLISIHLMLLFILLPVCSLLCMSRISIHLMLLFIEFGRFLNKLSDHFNTSHVTVYLPKDETEEIDVWFQYISCYCLSSPLASIAVCKFISIHLMLLFIPKEKQDNRIEQIFQYISCYCLSDRSESATVSSTDISIHLMLLFITANIIQIYIICQISIHLMLLFIQVVGVM